MSEDDLPSVTHEGIWEIGDLKIRVYRLTDGRSVIHADDFHKVLEWMGLEDDRPHPGDAPEGGR